MTVAIHVPVRVCDVGGWTDTWFAGHGRVCSLAVEPGVEVRASASSGAGRVTFDLVDYAIAFGADEAPPDHRLLAAAVDEAGSIDGLDVELRIASAVPPGCSLGTSASVCVGVIAALDAVRGGLRSPAELARAAHRAEAGRDGRESGVQDQVAAAHGGAGDLEVRGYPHVERRALRLAEEVRGLLDRQLLHVAYGAPHDSSAVHQEVIAALQAEGRGATRLDALRLLAGDAAAALESGDLDRYGGVLTAATDGQANLHPALVSDHAHQLIDLARRGGAVGWKVNGAGGDGGSISILCRSDHQRDEMRADAHDLGHRPLDLQLAPAGARVVST